jgi:hypothetical protein
VAFVFREFTISVNRVSRALVQLKAVLFTLAFFWPLGQRPEIRAAFRVCSLECSFPVEWGACFTLAFFWPLDPKLTTRPFSKNPSSHFLRLHLFWEFTSNQRLGHNDPCPLGQEKGTCLHCQFFGLNPLICHLLLGIPFPILWVASFCWVCNEVA